MRAYPKTRTCSIFGHAPDALPSGFDPGLYRLRLIFVIKELLNDGVTDFITGFVPGVDLWCAYVSIFYMERGECQVRAYLRDPPAPASAPDRLHIRQYTSRIPFISTTEGLSEHGLVEQMIDDSTDVLVISAENVRPYPLHYALQKQRRVIHLQMEEIIADVEAATGRIKRRPPYVPHKDSE